MNSPVSTHVLDTSLGKPAVGIVVRLERLSEGNWLFVSQAATDADGRIMNLLPPDQPLSSATYRMTFLTGDYFFSKKQASFYPKVTIEFLVSPGQHYHVPLLISPYGYTTYRGS